MIAGAATQREAGLADAKNVLLIVVDQWRGDHLGCLGASWVKTPQLDALARRGVTFSRNFCQGAPCGPARTSLQTGKYVMNHRVVYNGVDLDPKAMGLKKIEQQDRISVTGLQSLAPGKPVVVTLHKTDGRTLTIQANHSMTEQQIAWFKAGSALNALN